MVNQKKLINEMLDLVNKHKPTPEQLRYCFKQVRKESGLRTEKRKNKLPVYLTPAEVYALRKGADTCGVNHSYLIHLLLSTGLRVSEAHKLDVRDFDISANTIMVKEGKGGKERIVPLSNELYRMTRLYVGDRDKGRLFRLGNKVVSVRTLQRWVSDSAIAAGLEKKVSPHVLRHTFATLLLNKGFRLEDIQLLLGHSSRVTTEIYAKIAFTPELKQKYLQLTEAL